MLRVVRVDTAVWNLGVPLVLVGGCSEIIKLEPHGDGGGSSSGAATTIGTTVATTLETTDPTLPDPTTMDATSVDPSDSDPTMPACGEQCPPGYCCVDMQCVYLGCSPECPQELCCIGMCPPYGCYSDDECGPGSVCDYGGCLPIEYEPQCMLPLLLEFQIEIPYAGDVRTLAFVDADGDPLRDVLIGEGTSVQLVRAIDQLVMPIDVGVDAISLAVGDLDLDMDEDVLVADRTSGMLRMLLHEPMDSFVPTPLTDMPGVSAVALMDGDGDGIIDLLSVDDYNGLQWLRGLGGGVFDAPLPMFAGPTAIAVGWLDGDMFQDVVAHQGLELAFTGGPPFAFAQLSEHGNGTAARALAVGNFDGSAPDDVVAFHPSVGTTVMTSWRSDVTAHAAYKSWWYGNTTIAARGDLDDDGHDDVVTAGGEGQLVIAHGGPPIATSDVIDCIVTIPTKTVVTHLAVGDFTGDGDLDVVTYDGMQLFVYVQTS